MESKLKENFLDEIENRKQSGEIKFFNEAEYEKLSARNRARLLKQDEYVQMSYSMTEIGIKKRQERLYRVRQGYATLSKRTLRLLVGQHQQW